MILRIGPQLKPFGAFRTMRHKSGGPVAWWIADQGGTFLDVTPTLRKATIVGSLTAAAGPRGPALGFNLTGAGSYVSVPDLPMAGSFTVSAWAYPTAITTNNMVLARTQNSGSFSQNYILFIVTGSPNYWAFQVRTTADHRCLATISPVLNTWTHLAGVYRADLNISYLYINGVLNASASGGDVPGSGAGQTTNIGAYDTGADTWSGLIDDVRIYSRALSAGEVLADYLDPWWRLRRRERSWVNVVGGGGGSAYPWWIANRGAALGSGCQ